MENRTATRGWNFKENKKLVSASGLTVRSVLNKLMSCVDPADTRPVIPLGHGDPSSFPCFRTTPIAEDAISDALHSATFNGYPSTVGILPARRYHSLALCTQYLHEECQFNVAIGFVKSLNLGPWSFKSNFWHSLVQVSMSLISY